MVRHTPGGPKAVPPRRECGPADLIEVVLQNMEQGVAAFDRDGWLVAANPRFRAMHELPHHLCSPGRHMLDLTRFAAARGDYGPGDPEALALAAWKTASAGNGLYRSSSVGPRGQVFEVTGRPMPGGGFVNTYTDVTEARITDAALRESEARFRQIAEQLARQNAELEAGHQQFDATLDNISQGVTFVDRDHRLIVCNRRYREIYRLSPEQTRAGTPLMEILTHRVTAGTAPKMTLAAHFARSLALSRTGTASDYMDELDDGRIIVLHSQTLPNGSWVTTHEDVTARRRAEADIVFLARHDALTGLPNRVLFNERLEHAMEMAGRGMGFALLCLDLDRFKLVNDTLGHPAGDGLLRAVADRLSACVRGVDTVARLGGDEFAIIQLGVARPNDAATLANRIIAASIAPFDVDGHHITAGLTVGVTVAPADGTSSAKLMKNADIALYQAKSDRRGTIRFFEPEMDASIQRRRILELDLRAAMTANQFELYYQPLIELASGRISGFEALLRWRHPTRGFVMPMDFIPLAEETGLIVGIGEWVMRTACAEARSWPAGTVVAVNLSSVQFRKGNLVATVKAALAESGLPPERMELEITETVLLQESVESVSALHQLRAMGITIALDDFGTGYSSLSYLRRFPFDKIKVDQSFVRDLTKTNEALSIVRAIVGLAHSLDMRATAEGVETQEQLDILRAEGCDEVQGYFFSKPKPAADLPALIDRLSVPRGT